MRGKASRDERDEPVVDRPPRPREHPERDVVRQEALGVAAEGARITRRRTPTIGTVSASTVGRSAALLMR